MARLRSCEAATSNGRPASGHSAKRHLSRPDELVHRHLVRDGRQYPAGLSGRFPRPLAGSIRHRRRVVSGCCRREPTRKRALDRSMGALPGSGCCRLCRLHAVQSRADFTTSWTGIAALLTLDRLGKGVRTAPRDALISLSVPRERLGLAFGVHRAMDAVGAMLGPIVAFAILGSIRNGFDVVFVTSLCLAIVGVAVLGFFVENRRADRGAVPERDRVFRRRGALAAREASLSSSGDRGAALRRAHHQRRVHLSVTAEAGAYSCRALFRCCTS